VAIGAAGLMAQAPQAPALAADPAGCLKAFRDYRNGLMKDLQTRARESGKPLTSQDVNGITATASEYGKACAAQFTSPTLSAADLATLAELNAGAQQFDAAKQLLARAMVLPGVDDAGKAAIFVTSARILSGQIRQPGVLDQIEQYVTDLEKLPASFVKERIEAHGVLNSYYRADDIDAGIIRHSTRIIDLGQALTAEQRVPLASTLIAAYGNLAEALAGQERTPEALDYLRRAPRDLAGVPGVAERLASTLERCQLVGTQGAPIEAPRWLNATPAGGRIDPKGQVTWVQFTAHWCGPCRESYPGVGRLLEKYGPKGFRVVMATQLYGYFEQQRNLNEAAEMAAITEYFPKHGITVPIAVSDNLAPVIENGRMTRKLNVNDASYKVEGIPQIQILDKKGVIRLVMIGYDEANEARLGALIARLVNE